MENVKDIAQPKPQESKTLSPMENLVSGIENEIEISKSKGQQEIIRDFIEAIENDDVASIKESKNNEHRDKPILINSIRCRNESLQGQTHPITGVPFKAKEILVNPQDLKPSIGVFPEFKSEFTAQLPSELQQATDDKQFTESNKQLKEKYDSDKEFANKFNERQKDDIMSGRTPYGYTWHHNEDIGKMQLVDYNTHSKTAHTGGKAIWGGGSENR